MKKTTRTSKLAPPRTLTANDLQAVAAGNNPLYQGATAEVMNNPLYQGAGASGTNPLYKA